MRRIAHAARTTGAAGLAALIVLQLAAGTMAAARVGDAPTSAAGAARAVISPSVVDDVGAIRKTMALRERGRTSDKPAQRRATRSKAAAKPDVSIFGGLGAWIDLYDYDLDPLNSIAVMKAQGVRTLYLQTARYNTPYAIHPQARTWLIAAHRAGIKVVGWYLPGYARLATDVNRSVAIAKASYNGHRFDGVGVDIEFRRLVPSLAEWNRRVARQMEAVKRAVGESVLVAGITPSPVQMKAGKGYWAGFPWKAVAANSDVIMTMSYWSERSGCPRIRMHCAYGYTKTDVYWARRFTGNTVPIHIIGGVGDRVPLSDMRDFANAAAEAKAYGASIYDFRTTSAAAWRFLAPLRRL